MTFLKIISPGIGFLKRILSSIFEDSDQKSIFIVFLIAREICYTNADIIGTYLSW